MICIINIVGDNEKILKTLLNDIIINEEEEEEENKLEINPKILHNLKNIKKSFTLAECNIGRNSKLPSIASMNNSIDISFSKTDLNEVEIIYFF